MAETRIVSVRVPESLESAVRESVPELAALDLSTLMRVGLAVLAGNPVPAAMGMARAKSGPKGPRKREGQAA